MLGKIELCVTTLYRLGVSDCVVDLVRTF